MVLAESFGFAPEKLRFICPDVGGGFGLRNNLYPEQAAILWAARRVGRPVKWTNDRSESFLTDYAGRDLVTTARIALNADGRITAYQVDHIGTTGGQTVTYVPLSNAYRVATTVYDIPLMHMRCRAMVTNTVPTAPFRGAGRPEATLVLERLIDLAAARLGTDRVKLRQKNLIARRKLPYRTASGLTYDSGDFTGNMKRMVEAADWKGFPARKRESRRRGKLRGIGISNYVETPVGIPHERVEVTVLGSGAIELAVGTQSTGQGHETTFAQVVADRLGLPMDDVSIEHGDTGKVLFGMGTYGSRSIAVGGTAILKAVDKIIAKGRKIAAHLMEAAEGDVVFEGGEFKVAGTDKKVPFASVALTAYVPHNFPHDKLEPGLNENAFYDPSNFTFPAGSYICEVEVDPATGAVKVERFTACDDFGNVINPMIVEGQVHGGLVQGIGQALTESCVYDDNGQLLSASYMDYSMPKADNVPSFQVATTETACTHNTLGVKGCGEAGAIGAPPAVMNAITDAIGVRIDMPATPEKVWRALQGRQMPQAAE
jgi:carbon-monoxide dehydrogenase large subunit